MSVAVIPMAQELGWSGLERGLVSSSFFWGYTLTQLPGGYISTKIGGAKVLAAGAMRHLDAQQHTSAMCDVTCATERRDS